MCIAKEVTVSQLGVVFEARIVAMHHSSNHDAYIETSGNGPENGDCNRSPESVIVDGKVVLL